MPFTLVKDPEITGDSSTIQLYSSFPIPAPLVWKLKQERALLATGESIPSAEGYPYRYRILRTSSRGSSAEITNLENTLRAYEKAESALTVHITAAWNANLEIGIYGIFLLLQNDGPLCIETAQCPNEVVIVRFHRDIEPEVARKEIRSYLEAMSFTLSLGDSNEMIKITGHVPPRGRRERRRQKQLFNKLFATRD